MNQTPAASQPQGGSSTMKWLLIILVIIIVLGGGYLVYAKYGKLASTTTSPSPATSIKASPSTSSSASVPADWKTYSNSTYDFSFKYPSSWEEAMMECDAYCPKLWPSGMDRKTNALDISAPSKNIDETKNMLEETDGRTFQQITIDGHKAYKSEIMHGVVDNVQQVIIEGNKGTLILSARGEPLNLFDQILSTFQFTP